MAKNIITAQEVYEQLDDAIDLTAADRARLTKGIERGKLIAVRSTYRKAGKNDPWLCPRCMGRKTISPRPLVTIPCPSCQTVKDRERNGNIPEGFTVLDLLTKKENEEKEWQNDKRFRSPKRPS